MNVSKRALPRRLLFVDIVVIAVAILLRKVQKTPFYDTADTKRQTEATDKLS